jgi:hypothetical protein
LARLQRWLKAVSQQSSGLLPLVGNHKGGEALFVVMGRIKMYTETSDGKVLLTLSHGDYSELLLALGYALGSAVKINEKPMAKSFLRLANTINDGNPDWQPYYVPDEETGELHEMSMVDIPNTAN